MPNQQNIYQEANVIDNNEKFLSLWKDADPGIAEVEDARERLAGLKELNSMFMNDKLFWEWG